MVRSTAKSLSIRRLPAIPTCERRAGSTISCCRAAAKASGVFWIDHETRSFLDQLRDTSRCRRHDRDPIGHSLHQSDGNTLVLMFPKIDTGEHNCVDLTVVIPLQYTFMRDLAEERDPVLKLQSGDLLLQGLHR